MEATNQILDTALLLRAQAGDVAAVEELVCRHDGSLRYFVRRLLTDTTAADDVVQEVWLAALRQMKRITCGAAFRVWLYRVARNLAVSRARIETRKKLLPLEAAADAPEQDQTVFTAEDAAAVHQAMARLTVEHREAITLRFMEEMSYEEIAQVIGCSIGTVRSRLHYAKKELLRAIGKEDNATSQLGQSTVLREQRYG